MQTAKVKTVFISILLRTLKIMPSLVIRIFLFSVLAEVLLLRLESETSCPENMLLKTKPENKDKTATKRTRSSVGDGLSGLSEEELRVIMEMRREKIAQKKAEENKPVIQKE